MIRGWNKWDCLGGNIYQMRNGKRMSFQKTNLDEMPLDINACDTLRRNSDFLKNLSQGIHYGGNALKDIPDTLKRVLKHGMWKRFMVGIEIVEFNRFEDFVTERLPYGLDATVDQIIALCEKDREALGLIDTEITRKPGGANNPEGIGGKSHKEAIVNHNNIMNDKTESRATQGTSIEYTLRRLRKDHPELHEKVLANELSPNAAAIEAGFRKKTVTIPVDVEAIARKLKQLLTLEQRQQIMEIWSKS